MSQMSRCSNAFYTSPLQYFLDLVRVSKPVLLRIETNRLCCDGNSRNVILKSIKGWRFRSDDDSSDEENEEIILEKLWKNRSRDFFVDTDCNKPSVFKPTKKSHVMFPHRDRVLKWDDYGEIIDHDVFCDPDLVAKERGETKKQVIKKIVCGKRTAI